MKYFMVGREDAFPLFRLLQLLRIFELFVTPELAYYMSYILLSVFYNYFNSRGLDTQCWGYQL